MNKWQDLKLEEVLNFYNGNVIDYTKSGKYPVFGSNGQVGLSSKYSYENVIIVGRVGAYCGAVFYVKNKCWATDNTIVVKPKNNANIKFLYYLLGVLNLNNFAGGSAQPLLTQGWLKPIKISLPPLATQQKIVKTISNYDFLIENNLSSIKLLEESARLTYEEWFLRFRINGNRLEINKDTGLPFGWQNVLLTEYIDLEKGVEPGSSDYKEVKTDQNVPFIRVGDLSKRDSDIYVSKNLTKNKIVTQNDIMISLDGSPGRVKFGMYGCYSTGIRKAMPKQKNISSIFIFNLLNSQYIKKLIEAHASGTTILHAGSSVKKMRFILPTDEVLDMYNNIEMKKFHLIINLLNKNKILKEAKDILLPRLMTGMIDVEKIDITV